MKKLLSAVLAALLIISVFVGCTDSGNNNAVTTTAGNIESDTTAESTELNHSVPADLNFDGAKIRIITANEAGNGIDVGVLADEATDKITESIYRRDLAVEDQLGVSLKTVAYDSYVDSYNTFRDSASSGSDDFEFTFARTDLVFACAAENTIVDLSKFGYVDLDMPWWDNNVNTDHLINDKLFCAVGSISVNDLLRTHIILFNANIFDDEGIEYPYADVDSGSWTIDKLAKLAADLNKDLNGDGLVSDMYSDRFGLTTYGWCSAYTLWYGCDGSVLGKDEDGMPTVSIDAAKVSNIYDKMNAAVNGSGSNFVMDGNLYGDMYASFTEGRAALTEACMMHLTHWESFRDMKNNYGIVPAPKYDEEQKDYISYAEVVEPAVAVPVVAAEKADMISAVLEVMAYEAYKQVRPAVFEVSLKERFSRDELSKKMLDIIAGSRRSCLASVFIPSSSLTTALPTILSIKADSLASYIERYKTAMEGALAESMAHFK